LGVIGGISLLVGGIGVMNIMLVSVVERHREIGIRRAIGAKRRDILWLFLAESITLSLFGGILGVAVGISASFIIAKVFHWQFFFFALPAIIGFAVSVFIGIFFGFYPAYQASKLDPILLLRT
jgi:putative ABC transport system permease protein